MDWKRRFSGWAASWEAQLLQTDLTEASREKIAKLNLSSKVQDDSIVYASRFLDEQQEWDAQMLVKTLVKDRNFITTCLCPPEMDFQA